MKGCVVTVKEREVGEPCFLVVELHEAVSGLPSDKNIIFDMPVGTDIEQARQVARQLNDMDVTVALR